MWDLRLTASPVRGILWSAFRGGSLETQSGSSSAFRNLLACVDPKWSERSAEEQETWVAWYARTARAIARQYAASFRDPCHDASDIMQEIRLKLLTKFRGADAPHRLLTERPCMRNLMGWKALDMVDWENAERRSARRRVPLPDEEVALPDRSLPPPDRAAEVTEEEAAFRRELREPREKKAYLLFRSGKTPRQVARILGRPKAEIEAVLSRLSDSLAARLLR